MNTYKRHRFPPDIISYAVWLYYKFNPATEILKTYWPNGYHRQPRSNPSLAPKALAAHMGQALYPMYSRRLKRKHRCYGDTSFIDEVATRIIYVPLRIRTVTASNSRCSCRFSKGTRAGVCKDINSSYIPSAWRTREVRSAETGKALSVFSASL